MAERDGGQERDEHEDVRDDVGDVVRLGLGRPLHDDDAEHVGHRHHRERVAEEEAADVDLHDADHAGQHQLLEHEPDLEHVAGRLEEDVERPHPADECVLRALGDGLLVLAEHVEEEERDPERPATDGAESEVIRAIMIGDSPFNHSPR